jgi:uncharacterized protein (DUF4415 family)
MVRKTDDPASRPDDDNPEWTQVDMRRARPTSEVLPRFIGEKSTRELLRRRPGRPETSNKKVNQTLRLDPDVPEDYRHEGSGWQTRINQVLREHMPRKS